MLSYLLMFQTENFIPSRAKLIVVHNTTKIERAKKNNRGLRQSPSSTMSQSKNHSLKMGFITIIRGITVNTPNLDWRGFIVYSLG